MSACLVLGAGGTGIAYIWSSKLTGRVGAVRSSIVAYLFPIEAAILGVMFRGDSISYFSIIGVVIAISGYEITTLTDDQIADLREHQIGYVSQFLKAEPRRGVKEIVIKSAIKKGIDEAIADEMAAAILTKLNIDESLWGTYPTLLSGGEKQRVAIARAFAGEPSVLFADEPTGNLDAKTGKNIIETMFALNKTSSTTLILVTHDKKLAEMCDREILLEAGKLVSDKAIQK